MKRVFMAGRAYRAHPAELSHCGSFDAGEIGLPSGPLNMVDFVAETGDTHEEWSGVITCWQGGAYYPCPPTARQ